MKYTILSTVLAALLAGGTLTAQDGGRDFKYALSLYEKGMYAQARTVFEDLAADPQAEGYAVLCAVCMQSEGYDILMDNYLERYPCSGLEPKLYWRHALNLFDAARYDQASKAFDQVGKENIPAEWKAEYLFKSAYSDFQVGDTDAALFGFGQLEDLPLCDYTAPARYATGYIYYEQERFREAIPWFELSAGDPRFADISRYYIMECRFMDGDYDYVIEHGAEMYDKVPQDRREHLARIISEAYLVKGDAQTAKKYFDAIGSVSSEDRGDLFYAGSLLYAVGDYAGAIDNYSRMTDRSDSLGQAANYNLAYSYIKTRDKVSALEAFKQASAVSFNPEIQEDAFFNYAKLSFDLNGDGSVFDKYLAAYSDKKRGDSVYAYQALAALHNHDYAAAVAAYDNIDELDPDMRSNYMKANYLRANQLIRNGSWRNAVPCLKAAAYYSDKHAPFNQLSRYWLAESYFRDDLFTQSRAIYTDLYNLSALDGQQEGKYIPYNIAYCYFKENNYELAAKWFDEYLKSGDETFLKDARLRKADCYFTRKNYATAITAYQQAIADYTGVEDLYPYYQCGISYGLTGNADRKIEMLSYVNKANPETPFYAEALYELGRSYLDARKDAPAAVAFEKLVRDAHDSTYIARGLIGLGTVAKNAAEYDKALDYYKKVVKTMPSTTWSADALLAIESIYQARQEPEKYLAYIESLGTGSPASEQDKEEMLFNGAEQIYLAGNWQKALVSLQSYRQRYPSGKYLANCWFYEAECYRNLDRKEQACDFYKKVMDDGSSSFTELASSHYARLSFSLERYADAFAGFDNLHRVARIESNKFLALQGMMRSAYEGKDYGNAIKYAALVESTPSLPDGDAREARYIRAKALLASSNREEAVKLLESLAADPVHAEGAEAAYMLILDSYDRGKFKDVEERVYALSDSGTPQTYWLAKSFLTLGDTFVESGDFHQARATFESIRDGYTPSSGSDDIPEAVRLRLDKLTEMGK